MSNSQKRIQVLIDAPGSMDSPSFDITADLDTKDTWEWVATIQRGHDPVVPPKDIRARTPYRCLAKATEWIVGEVDRGSYTR